MKTAYNLYKNSLSLFYLCYRTSLYISKCDKCLCYKHLIKLFIQTRSIGERYLHAYAYMRVFI